MGKAKAHPPVKLIAAITISRLDLWGEVKDLLEKIFSPIDLESQWYDFHHTDYYTAEMGGSLKKRMVAFQNLVLAEDLPTIKLTTNEIEDRFAREGKRRVNIDPGYIASAKLVLATTKDYGHRIYLGRGIFGDLHLRFHHKHFHPQEWTYPDYREPLVLHFFETVRDRYLNQLARFYHSQYEESNAK